MGEPERFDRDREPERFDRYMERCLYGTDGFYANSGIAGRRNGDFLTSPEVGPLFGAVLARALFDGWERAGRPEPYTVYDVGCGPGTLLKTVAVAMRDLDDPPPWRLVGVDRVDSPGADTDHLPDDLSSAALVANELLDNLPFRVLEGGGDGTLAELHVVDGAEHLVSSDLVPSDLVASGVEPFDLAAGRRAPYHERARGWIENVLARQPTQIHLFDYGAPTTAQLAARGGWLRTYRSHQRGDDPLLEPGRWDITTDVAWDQLPAPDRLETQADFLARWGVADLVEEGRRYWDEHAARPDVRAMRLRSRIIEADALTEPAGLGGWWVASWWNLAEPTPLGLIHDHG